jgi:predicted ArsR family transcriptional regulator
MQQTRQHILELLREHGEATVEQLVEHLQARRGKITAVTVRHHLLRLQEDELITQPQLRHRSTPGRPQHVYMLTDKAQAHFPNNYQQLAQSLLSVMRAHVPPQGVNVILQDVAEQMSHAAHIPDLPPREKMNAVVQYLTGQGYSARWEDSAEGFVLHTHNCPYHEIAQHEHALCDMDMRLVATLLGVVPRRISSITSGGASCAYLIPLATDAS